MNYERFKSNMFYLVIAVLLPLGSFIMNNLGVNENFMEISYMYLFMFIPVILFVINDKRETKEILSLKKVSIKQLLIAVLIVLALQPITALVAGFTQTLLGQGDSMAQGMQDMESNYSLFKALFVIAITPALCEELVMRGVVLSGYKNLSFWKIALMNGVLFGLFHNNFMQLFYTMVAGIVLSYVVLITSSILPAMLMHFIMNAMSVVLERYPSNVFSKFVNWYESDILILCVLSLVSVVVIVLLFRVLKKCSHESKCETTNEDKMEKRSTREESINTGEVTMIKNHVDFVEWPLMMASIISIVYSLCM